MTITTLKQSASRIIVLLNHLQPLWWLAIRLWIAQVFFASGLTKVEDFASTIILFAEEYKVPLLPPYLAAFSATFFELTMPVALVLGLGARLAAFPLLIMTGVIEFSYQHHAQHVIWAMALCGIMTHGAGKLSLDYLLAKRFGTAARGASPNFAADRI